MRKILILTFLLMLMLSSICLASQTDTLLDNSIKKPTVTIITYPSKGIRNNKETVDLINEKIHQKFDPIKNPLWQYKFLIYGTDTSLELQEMVEKIMARNNSQFFPTAEDLVSFGKEDKDDVVIFVHLYPISVKVDPGFFTLNYHIGLECVVRAIKTNENKYYYYKTVNVRGESGGQDHAIQDGINKIFELINTDVNLSLPTIEEK